MLTGAPITPGYSLVNGITSPTGTPSDSARVQVINPTAPLAQRFGPPPEPAGQSVVPWSRDQHRSAVRQPGQEHDDRSRNE